MVRSRIIDMTGKKLDVVLASNIFEHVLSVKMAQRPTSVGILANQMREFELGARILHLRHRGLGHRSAVRDPVHRRTLHDRRPAGVDSRC